MFYILYNIKFDFQSAYRNSVYKKREGIFNMFKQVFLSKTLFTSPSKCLKGHLTIINEK